MRHSIGKENYGIAEALLFCSASFFVLFNEKDKDASPTAYYKRITEKSLTLLDGTQYQYEYKTIEK